MALVRTAGAIEPREVGLEQRAVVMEFESLECVLATYNGAAYQGALKVAKRMGQRPGRPTRHDLGGCGFVLNG